MKGTDLLRELRAYAKANGLDFRLDKNRGKGSHQTVWVGEKKCVLPDPRKELKSGTLAQILRNLGVDRLFRQDG